ncbi:hypothetical protein QJQ45_005026 [Haematococcus lacustris]|nr:hypothetical protein QJQ45_005026 [Haematococcus lacustris]
MQLDIAELITRSLELDDLRQMRLITWEGLAQLSCLENLTHLNCTGIKYEPHHADTPGLPTVFSRLTSLIIGDSYTLSYVDDSLMAVLAKHSSGLAGLAPCKQLAQLNLKDCSSLVTLSSSRFLTSLRSLNLSRCDSLPLPMLPALSSLTNLTQLDVSGQRNMVPFLDAQALDAQLCQGLGQLTALQVLDLSGLRHPQGLPAGLLLAISQLTSLRSLLLADVCAPLSHTAQAIGLSFAAPLTQLTHLDLTNWRHAAPQQLAHLAHLTALHTLELTRFANRHQCGPEDQASPCSSCSSGCPSASQPSTRRCSFTNVEVAQPVTSVDIDQAALAIWQRQKQAPRSRAAASQPLERLWCKEVVDDSANLQQDEVQQPAFPRPWPLVQSCPAAELSEDCLPAHLLSPSSDSLDTLVQHLHVHACSQLDLASSGSWRQPAPYPPLILHQPVELLASQMEQQGGSLDACMAHLRPLTSLRHLRLAGCSHLSDAGVGHLVGLGQLCRLDLSSCKALQGAFLPALLVGTPHSSLHTLTLEDCCGLQNTHFSSMARAAAPFPNEPTGLHSLTNLGLGGCVQLGDEAALALAEAGAPHLTSLSTRSWQQLSSRGANALVRELRELQTLSLSHCWKVGQQTADQLKAAGRGLSHLDCSHCPSLNLKGVPGWKEAVPGWGVFQRIMPGRGGRRGGAPQATFAEQQLAEERASNGQAMYSGLNPASNGIRPASAAPRPQNSRGIVGRPASAVPAIATAAPVTTSAAPRAPLSHNSNPSPSQAQPAQQQRQQQQQQQRQQQPKAQQHAPAAEPAPRVEHGIPATHHIPVVALQHQSNTRFADLPVSDLTKRAMAEVFKYEYCTHVQSQALPACLAGGDVLAKAKTGTGKTIAFGIPVIETLLARPQPRGQVGALILSPTRELAYQIHAEFVKLLTFHKLSLQVMIGGTNLNSEAGRLKKCVPDILVATPGRCLDHMTNEASQLQRYMSGCRVLVCDEADNLLDMGFKPTIERILNFLPPRGQRQALLFSATFPQDVQSLARFALNAPYTTVDTVGEETSTNVQVEQQEAVVPFEEQFAYLYASLLRHTKEDPEDYKVIVFFPTARQTQIYAEAFEAAGMPVLEIHSRKSQAQRTRVSDEFRRNSRVMMFSSDVSARGVDYPDVSLVVQVGAPSDKAQYVHRVGRTARAGKAGKALLMLCDFEADFRRQLKELPLVPAPALSPAEHRAATNAMATGLSRVSSETKSKAYQAWLGFYKSCPWVKMSPAQVVAQANSFATVMGCLEPPELQASTVGKMGLKVGLGQRACMGHPHVSGGRQGVLTLRNI